MWLGVPQRRINYPVCGVNYQLLNYHNATSVAQCATPSCSRPQRAMDNGIRDDGSNWLSVTPYHLLGSTPWASFAQYKSAQHHPGIEPSTFCIRYNHVAYAATQGITPNTEFLIKIIQTRIEASDYKIKVFCLRIRLDSFYFFNHSHIEYILRIYFHTCTVSRSRTCRADLLYLSKHLVSHMSCWPTILV